MQNNALILALKKLSRKEMTRFRDFSLSPYYNKHAGVRDLVGYFSEKYPDFSEKNCDRKAIWRRIFPERKYDYPHLALLFTYALRLADKFFAAEKLAEKPAEEQFLTAEFLRERRLFKTYEKTMRSIEKILEKASYRDADFYFRQYLFADERDQKYLKITRRRADDGLQEKQDALDVWFAAMKLRDACEMRMRQRYFGEEYEADWLKEISEKIKNRPQDYLEIPAVYIYFLVYEMLTGEAVEDYFVLKNKVEVTAAFFSKSEQQNIYNYLQNFCILQINKGNSYFLREIFSIYQSQLERELIFEKNGTLAEFHYKNIVTTGLRSQAYDWVRNFLEEYKPRLSPAVAENAYSFNLANYYFAIEKYKEILPLLIQVEYSDMRYKLDSRALLLRTYYHLGEAEAFYALCDSFKQLLLRSKDLTEFQRTGYQNMIRMSRQIYTWHAGKNFIGAEEFAREGEKITTEVNELNPLFNAEWLKGRLAHQT